MHEGNNRANARPEVRRKVDGAMRNETVERVLAEVQKVILGKDEVIAKVLMAILAQGHVLLEDVPGTGKTTMALAFAKALGLDYRRVQFTSDTMPSDIIGFSVYDRESGKLSYKPGAIMTNLLLADEINRTSSKTQSALLEAMEEKRVTIDGVTHDLPEPFVVLATENPVGSAGTQMLPNSQLDRFIVQLSMGYPSLESQIDILKERHAANPLDSVQPVLTKQELKGLIDEAAHVHLADALYRYISMLVEATRSHEFVELGLSPRGALAFTRMAQAQAYVQGRTYVSPEDVLDVFADVATHRLILNAKARLNEMDATAIVADIAASVPIPQRSANNPLDA